MAVHAKEIVTRINSWRTSTFLIVFMVVTACFVDEFTYSMVIPILPYVLRQRLHIDHSISFWVGVLIASYNAAVLFSAPALGIMADAWASRKLPLLLGLLTMGVSLILFMLGDSIVFLALARGLQGISSSAVWAVGLALLVETVGPESAGFAIGWVGPATSFGSSSGPVLGGIVFHQSGYYSVFFMATGLLALEVILRLFIVEKKRVSLEHEEERVQSRARTNSHTSIRQGNDSSASYGTIAGSSTDASSSLLQHSDTESQIEEHEAKGHFGSLVYLLTYPEVCLGLWGCFMSQLVQRCIETLLPVFTADKFGWSSQASGIIFLALTIPLFSAPVVGYLCDRYGSKRPTLVGLFLMATGLTCLSLVRNDETGDIILLSVLLAFIGLGICMVMTPQFTNVAVFSEIKERENPGIFGHGGATAQSCALIHMAYAIAGITGPLIAGAIYQEIGWNGTNLLLGLVSFASIVPFYWMKR